MRAWDRPAASLYKADGVRFAAYAVNATAATPEDEETKRLDRTTAETWRIKGRFAHLWRPVALDGEQIGVIHLAADTEPMAAHWGRSDPQTAELTCARCQNTQ